MNICKKCDPERLGQELGIDVVLVGGVVVTLCTACRTAWHEFIVEHNAFKRLEYLTAVVGSIIANRELTLSGGQKCQEAMSEARECKRVLFEAAQEWLDE